MGPDSISVTEAGIAGLLAPADRKSLGSTTSSTASLLFLCARRHVDPEAAARIQKAIEQGVDWQLFDKLIERHRLTPLIHHHCLAWFESAVPEALAESWNLSSRCIALRNIVLANELVRLLEIFRANEIQAIPYKGPVLAAWIYGDLSLRTYYDLDLIVRRGDLARAKELVLARGYQPLGEGSIGSLFAEESCHLIFVHAKLDITVEIHWALAPSNFPLSLRGARLWQDLTCRHFGACEVLTHNQADLLLILAVHAGKHHWSRLTWILDIAELIRQNQNLAWDTLRAEAIRHRCRRMLSVSLALAYNLLEAPVPDTVRREWDDDPAVATICNRVAKGMVQAEPDESDEAWVQWNMRERWRDRIENAIRVAATPTEADKSFLKLPSVLQVLYLPVRALRLALKYTWQRVWG